MSHWEKCYQDGDTHWDRGAPSPPLAQYISEHPIGGLVLVPGCGTGHDAAYLAEQGADVTGLDIAPTAVERASANYPELAGRFVEGDLFDLPQTWNGRFDHVVEHTCFCAIPPAMREAYCAAVHRVLRPEGTLIGVWFINPELDPGHEGPPFPSATEELDQIFGQHFDLVTDYIPDTAYPGREGRERVRVWKKRG